MEWNPIWALPNIDLAEPIDSQFISLVPSNDKRVHKIEQNHPEFGTFMTQFTDTYGNQIRPSLILSRADTPRPLLTVEAIGSFRNAIVVSTVPYARARDVEFNNVRNRVSYSSFFCVYPWTISRDYTSVYADTPTMRAIHEAQALRGQSSPDLSPTKLARSDVDEPLLKELLERWSTCYRHSSPSWENLALFRSLNMANQASAFPGGADATIHDYGRIAGLWVASFEILVHPGGSGRANLMNVLELLEAVPWINKRCKYRRYNVRIGKKVLRKNLVCWLYRELYRCRNDFLHGNPVDNTSLKIRQSGRTIVSFGPILHRLALTSFLELSFRPEPPDLTETEAMSAYMSDRMEFRHPQDMMERAICLARVSEEEQRRCRDERVRQARDRSRQIANTLSRT